MPVNVLTRAEKGEALTYEQMDNNLLALQDAVNSKAEIIHGHSIADITGLQDALDRTELGIGVEITDATANGILYVNADRELSSDGGFLIKQDAFLLSRMLSDSQAVIQMGTDLFNYGIDGIIWGWLDSDNNQSAIIVGDMSSINEDNSSIALYAASEYNDEQSRFMLSKQFTGFENFNQNNRGAVATYSGIITLFSEASDTDLFIMNLRYPEGFSIYSSDGGSIFDINNYGNGYWHAKDGVSGKQASVYMDNDAGAMLYYFFDTKMAYINVYDNRLLSAVADAVANTALAQIITSNEYSIQDTVNGRVYFAIDTLTNVYNWGNVDELGNGTRLRIQDNLGLVEIFGRTEINGYFYVNDDRIAIATPFTPASSSAAGTKGDMAWDDDYVYVCIDTDTWKRAALSTW